jgi:S1-C subfamily serine protease
VLNAREGGPAWRAGIRGTSRDEYGRLVLGDIITAINGSKVRNSSDLYKVLDKATVSAYTSLRASYKQYMRKAGFGLCFRKG